MDVKGVFEAQKRLSSFVIFCYS